jgi:hypothetical protein
VAQQSMKSPKLLDDSDRRRYAGKYGQIKNHKRAHLSRNHFKKQSNNSCYFVVVRNYTIERLLSRTIWDDFEKLS